MRLEKRPHKKHHGLVKRDRPLHLYFFTRSDRYFVAVILIDNAAIVQLSLNNKVRG